MSGSSKKKKGHGGHEEEHENHERWLITYADMITLLMVLFIVLFAIGQTDLAKYKQLKSGLSDGFGTNKISIVDGGLGLADNAARSATVATTPDTTPEQLALSDAQAVQQAQAVEQRSLAATQSAIEASLKGSGQENAIEFRSEARGLVLTVLSDRVLFKAGIADLTEEGRKVLGTVAEAILPLTNPISIEGHTDNVPIAGRYASNWELSTARATSVLRDLVEGHEFPAVRLSASGYADQKPIASNDTPAGRSANRRVEIVVLTTVEHAPAASHPGDAGSTPTSTTTVPAEVRTELSATASTISFSEPLPASAERASPSSSPSAPTEGPTATTAPDHDPTEH